jgi:ATP-binding cassette, subfamily B, bacterial PglK
MIADLKKINKILNAKEKKKLIYLSLIKFFSGFMDMVGIASIVPFIAIVSNKEILNNNVIIQQIKIFFNFQNYELIIFLAFSSLFFIILNQLIRILSSWYSEFCTNNLWYFLCTKLFRFYLNRPYIFHLKESSNSLLEKVEVRANSAVAGVITPFFTILGNIFTSLFLALLLIWVDPTVAIILIVSTGFFYLFIYLKVKQKITLYGEFAPTYYKKTFKLIDQAFRSIKDIKIKNNENFYSNLFNPLTKKFVNYQIKLHVFGFLPRNLLEIFVFTFGFSLILYLLIADSRVFNQVIIVIGVYAIALQKVLPAAQSIFQQITSYKYYKPTFDSIYSDLTLAIEEDVNLSKVNLDQKKINFQKKIQFKDITFEYPDTGKIVLDLKDLEIVSGKFIGITGKSGSGKSTLLDLMIGLLEPSSGTILIDDKNLDLNSKNSWRSNIGYVPQFPFMADDTIVNNIALGVNPDLIDFKKIKDVAKIAKISEFIENDLPSKYETVIGESGVRLSGGQKQRIGIARALYNDRQIIVLDEATNSLDVNTEDSIIDSILSVKKNKTIIMVTHRVQSLKKCDKIFILDKGTLFGQGSFNELINTNLTFKNLGKNN